MRIVVAGPVSLDLLGLAMGAEVATKGYPFPFTAQLAIEYSTAGHDVTVVTSATDIHSTQHYSGNGLSLTVVPARGNPNLKALDGFSKERKLLADAMRDARPDAIHAHWTYEFALAAQSTGVPTTVTVHDWAPAVFKNSLHPYRLIRWGMQVMALRAADRVNAPSKYIADRVQQKYEKPCRVIPNGLNKGPYLTARGIDPVVGLLNVGFSRLKNVRTALRAWPGVVSAIPNARLILAGDGYEVGGPAHKWAEARGLCEGVQFVGRIAPADLPKWFSGLRLFVQASREESFGMVLIEAIASGVPVIGGANSGAVPEVLSGNGQLVDINSKDALANAIISSLSHSFEEQVIGYASVLQRYDIAAVAAQHLQELIRVSAR